MVLKVLKVFLVVSAIFNVFYIESTKDNFTAVEFLKKS